MKKFYIVVLAFCVSLMASAQEWNITDAIFDGYGTFLSKTVVSGLSIYSVDGSGTVSIDPNNKSIDGYDFTRRLKLGGTGNWVDETTPNYRVLEFDVAGNSTITVYGMSSSSTAGDRQLVVASGDNATELGRLTNDGTAIGKLEVSYVGGPTKIFVFSAGSGFNIYMIKSVDVSTAIGDINRKKVSADYYGINGLKVSDNFNSLNRGIYIEKAVYDDGTVSTKKVFKGQ